jgi:hypothetical protein
MTCFGAVEFIKTVPELPPPPGLFPFDKFCEVADPILDSRPKQETRTLTETKANK